MEAKIKKSCLFLVILILVLLGLLLVQHSKLNFIEGKKEALASNFSLYKMESNNKLNQLQTQISQLNRSYNLLREQKGELDKEYTEINDTYQILKKEANETIKTLQEYELEIKESMSWFKLNSDLNNINKPRKVERELNRDCFKIRSSKCYIKTGCLYLINREKLDLEYKKDIDTTGNEDKLQSLSDFIEKGGGDCEDYALFYKAELNYILEQCREREPDNIIFESYYIDELSSDRYWMDYNRDWYLEATTESSFDTYIYPCVVCGNIYDLNSDENYAHCVVAFTKNKINNIENVSLELDGAPLIEPQDGSFIGFVNGDSYGANQAVDIEDITDVITDIDYYKYIDKSGWLGYSFFSNKLKEQQNKLSILLNK